MPIQVGGGTTVGGRYRALRLLGVGGSASVYEAEDLTSGGIIALKMPHDTSRPNSVAARRLLREARVSKILKHPNVCGISDVGTLPGGAPFTVMERLVGATLRDRIMKGGYLPFSDIIDIMMQVLSGLGAAHERGVVHRDVKPENIFLAQRPGRSDLVKIFDFGLVTSAHPEREELTDFGTVVGTPCYMAPEQIRGVRDFDVRVDLYACGVVLYEATAGRRPFTSPNQGELFRQIVAGSPTPIRDLRPDTPTRLVEVIAKAMSPSPMCRFASASAFQQALSGIQIPPPTSDPVPFNASESVALQTPSMVRRPGVDHAPAETELRTLEIPIRKDWDQQPEWDEPTSNNPEDAR